MRLGQVTPGLVADGHATCTEVEAPRHEGRDVAENGGGVLAYVLLCCEVTTHIHGSAIETVRLPVFNPV